MKPSLSSLYQAVELRSEIPPLMIGERTNANGSKLFRERLLADDYAGCLQIGVEQENNGAQVLDLCVAYAGRDEINDIRQLVPLFAQSVKIPLMIDSTIPEVIEEALKLYPGRCIVNSINLEDGEKTTRKVLGLVRKYGAAVVALTISEQGMAMTTADKVAVAKRIYTLAVEEYGLRPHDLMFDALTFTIGAGDETLVLAAVETLDAIREIKAAMPGVGTVLGLSNISFGLSPASRRVLNSVFLHEAVEAGLDAAIVDAGKIVPLARISDDDRQVALNLIYNRGESSDGNTPLTRFIEHFKDASATTQEDDAGGEQARYIEQVIFKQVVDGVKDGIEDNLAALVSRQTPLEIINQILVPAMRRVGELFGKGELLLPFVLQSAEVMRRAVAWLEPLMPREDASQRKRVLLATVQGDVHDIGKNLVDIIFSNNGYEVVNIGIKVPVETIIAKAQEHKVDVIGLSGLLVKSALVMQENLRQFRDAGLEQPVLLGGAALTPRFVAESCVPNYSAPVVYCADAFAGLKALRSYEDASLVSTVWHGGVNASARPGAKEQELQRDAPVPEPPFWGCRQVKDIDLSKALNYINKEALFRGRWGYRRGKMSAEEYEELLEGTVRPIYNNLVDLSINEGLLKPKVTYGYFRCFSRENEVVVLDGADEYVFDFPRQGSAPYLCISDYFRSEKNGGDVVGFFVVTMSDEIAKVAQELYASNSYHDYLMHHGFGVEATDALAEYWHAVMRRELGIAGSEPETMDGFVTQGYQGSRFGFGYPACPDLESHRQVFALLKPELIGVTLTESMFMVPEQSTSAIIAHHPQAKYFAV